MWTWSRGRGTPSAAVTSTRCSTYSLRRPRLGFPETLPWGGTYAGPEGFGDFVARLNDNFDQFTATPDKVLGADDNHVIVVAKVKGRTKGGATIENRAVWVYQLREGRIADAETFGDTAQVLQALG